MDRTLGSVATVNACLCSVGVMDTEIARMAVMKNVMLQTVATNFQCASCAKQEMIMAVMLYIKLESLSVC